MPYRCSHHSRSAYKLGYCLIPALAPPAPPQPIEVIAGIIIDKTQEWQRRYEAALRDKAGMREDESMEDAEQQSYTGQDRQEEVSASALLPPGSDLCS